MLMSPKVKLGWLLVGLLVLLMVVLVVWLLSGLLSGGVGFLADGWWMVRGRLVSGWCSAGSMGSRRVVGCSFGGRRSGGMVVMAASVGANAPKAWPMRSPSLEEGGGTPRECAAGCCQLVVWAGWNPMPGFDGVIQLGWVDARPRP